MTKKQTETTKKTKVQDDLLVAGEIHTLANIIYWELAAKQPWSTSFGTPSVFAEPLGWPPMHAGGSTPGWCGQPPWTE